MAEEARLRALLLRCYHALHNGFVGGEWAHALPAEVSLAATREDRAPRREPAEHHGGAEASALLAELADVLGLSTPLRLVPRSVAALEVGDEVAIREAATPYNKAVVIGTGRVERVTKARIHVSDGRVYQRFESKSRNAGSEYGSGFSRPRSILPLTDALRYETEYKRLVGDVLFWFRGVVTWDGFPIEKLRALHVAVEALRARKGE